MPVVVAGAGGAVGRALIPLLVDRGSEVRATVARREAAEGLRALGAKVAVAEPRDDETLRLVLDEAHTVCHLAGRLDLPHEQAYLEENLAPVEAALEAAAKAGAARFLLLSSTGASPSSGNAYLRAKGLAEEAVRASGLEHAVLRATHVCSAGSAWLRAASECASRGRVVGPGTQRTAPVAARDVAAALAAADDRAAPVAGVFGLQGPDVVTAEELGELLGGKPRRWAHLPPDDRTARRLGVSVTLLELLAADSLADAPDAAAEFALDPTPLREALRLSR